jgi:hypothetical protein
MKIQSTTNKKTTLLLLLSAVAFAGLIAGYVYFVAPKGNQEETDPTSSTGYINKSAPTDSEIANGQDAKKATIEADGKSTGSSTGNQTSTPSSNAIALSVTAVFKSGDNVRVQTLISPIVSEGTCTLTASKSGIVSYTTTARVQALPSNSTCEGFTVPLDKLTAGHWKFTVVYSGGSISSSDSKELDI